MQQLHGKASAQESLPVPAGVVGGVAGAATMDLINWAERKLLGTQKARGAFPISSGLGHQSPLGRHRKSPTRIAASELSKVLPGARKSRRQIRALSELVHLGFGAIGGLCYCVLAQRWPVIRKGHGAVYGLGLWFAASEVGLPLAGLAEPPWRSRPGVQVIGAVSHLGFGIVLESVVRSWRQAGIDQPSPLKLVDVQQ
jgi:hypothetical protein